jgi:hypothetical protein
MSAELNTVDRGGCYEIEYDDNEYEVAGEAKYPDLVRRYAVATQALSFPECRSDAIRGSAVATLCSISHFC